MGETAVYIDRNDWWVGAYRGPNHWYVCPLPTLVIRFPRAPTQPGAPRTETANERKTDHGD